MTSLSPGNDVASAQEAFDNLSADQFWGKPQATHYGLVPISRPDTFFSGSEFYLTAKSERFALELAGECQAWGAKVERNGRDLVVSA